jgi:predicted AlkP superfamily pyrophosphatase or phosphodiesterase
MRYDYLQKFWDEFGNDGFRRLATEGYRMDNCHYNYIPTETAPGHASIHTGTTPSVHGIISNQWYDRGLGAAHSSVADPAHPRVGAGRHKGASPDFLMMSTLADEIKAATNFKGKSVGLSLKDRSAILPLGRSGDLAIWFDDFSGQWISSTYYLKPPAALPAWVTKLNASNLTATYLSKEWNLLRPADDYVNSDEAAFLKYEGTYYPDSSASFPHRFKTEPFVVGLDTVWPGSVIKATPYGNAMLEDLAEQAIVEMQLGADGFTDFLCVSFSSTDVIGHQFGPQSREVEDTYLRLDQEIADLLRFLDARCKGNVLVFLTADHGAAENPTYLRDHGHEGGFLADDVSLHLRLDTALGKGNVLAVHGHNVYLNHSFILQSGRQVEAVAQQCAKALASYPEVSMAFTAEELQSQPAQTLAEQYLRNGFHSERGGDVLYITQPGYTDAGYDMPWSHLKGTSHGSPWEYDTHVPLLFWGWRVPKGRSSAPAVIPDIAPTVSGFLGIQSPSGCTGKAISFGK